MYKVLIFSRDSNWFGGVVNFIDLMKQHFSPDIYTNQFLVGRRKGSIGLVIRPFTPFIDASRLLFHLLFNKYDCYHLNPSLNGPALFRDGFFIVVLKLLRRRNILLCFHGWEMSTQNRLENSAILKWLFFSIYCRETTLLVLAKPFREWLVKHGACSTNIHLFTTMFDGRFIENRPRDELSDHDEIVLLFLSRFVREKGIFELLHAFKKLLGKYENIRLVFAGTGPEETAMHEWVESEKIADKVEFKGYVRNEEKSAVLENAHVFVFPTYYGEGCPVSLLEAMAAGMAIVTTPVGGIPDIIKDGENGILIDGEVSDEAIYSAVESYLASPASITSVGNRNRIDAWKKYNAPVVTRFFEDIYAGFGVDK